jgi:glycosyltransferase involved in cell wall biosynthesis
MSRVGAGASCQLLGHRTDVIALHHAFDFFVQSSVREGTPNCVLEAMAMTTPLIATDVGGTTELVTDGVHGLIVSPGRSTALAEGIERALADRDAARARAAAARRRVETELSFDRRMERVEAIYEELLAFRPSYSRAKQVAPAVAPR